jgi:bifunctional UDP-N-acetylglucosamine pyrophosphorylase/glucosamine-1-phosphate N-acetyltransferase
VVLGDAPLLRTKTLRELVAAHEREGAATTVLSAELPDATGYGRVVRDADGAVTAIVEHKDADDAVRALREINSGVFAFDAVHLRDAIGRLSTDNAQGELYLTDVLGLHHAAGLVVRAHLAQDPAETMGVNDRVQLSQARRLLNDRLVERWQRAGVTVVDPATTWLDVDVELAPDVELRPGTQLHGRTQVAEAAVVGPDSTLRDVEVGAGASVVRTHAEGAVIGPDATVGPFTYLRPGTRLGRGSKAGAYVEIKASEVGEGSKVPHLSYVGDAVIGRDSNIGAATVFVNYDGRDKHRTVVGDGVRIGSDTMLVAAGRGGRRRLHGRGLGHHHGRPGRCAGRRPCTAAQHRGVGGPHARAEARQRRRRPAGRGVRVNGLQIDSRKNLMLFTGRAYPSWRRRSGSTSAASRCRPARTSSRTARSSCASRSRCGVPTRSSCRASRRR